MRPVIRSIRPDEWPAAKELRLAALQDPAAPVAFLETYEHAAAKADSFWRERTAGVAQGATEAQQFIAEAPDGQWIGTVVVLLEEAGTEAFGGVVERRQCHLVGVFVRPEYRGSGMSDALFEAALEWAWSTGVEQVRLFVHERNARAEGFYRKAGFMPTGKTVPVPGDPSAAELEFVIKRP
ncbi:GNAT family N-acetyltransferase [Streptomyces himalayensis]|uniref:GNAT family N-acetyltransferase n=1 Tax=Streptomyces himalayensis subsp. himalayensis TaxID=2756131 RepID=A0A7W0I9R6_9ACTN|nr:GNAT family N-acetyltransferase [Streptomyces himalayensis]MBA2947344.1 GNAT family N-acetyltransferase [Streptomyces himalayensis subsp. himalayensis]